MSIRESNKRIIELLVSGLTSNEIALELGFKRRRVEDRIWEMMKKNGCKTRAQLIAKKMNDKDKYSGQKS